jgi:hypothetical protein
MTFDQNKAMAATIAQREDSDARRQHVQEIMGLQIDIQNLINQKSQELKLMEMMGGSLYPVVSRKLSDTFEEIDGNIRKKTNKIEAHETDKGHPMATKPSSFGLQAPIVVHFHPFSHLCLSQREEAVIKELERK